MRRLLCLLRRRHDPWHALGCCYRCGARIGYVPGSTGLRAWLRRFRCSDCRAFIWRRIDRRAHFCSRCVPF